MTDLTTTEAARLIDLEATIERGLQTFVEVGNALLEIRDQRLYREQYATFEDYCRSRWGMSRPRAYQLIEAAEVVGNLSTIVDIPMPANEAQARALSKLIPPLQRTVWPVVVDTAPNGKVTANHIHQVVNGFQAPGHSNGNGLPIATNHHHPVAALAGKPICSECGQVYEGDACPDCDQVSSPAFLPKNRYNYELDNRRSRVLYTPQGLDACQTPGYALDPLLPYLCRDLTIWEPACGEGLLVEAFYDSGFGESQVVASDLQNDQDFFDAELEPDSWDVLITNPPFSRQFEWLERCYNLGKPFALLLKVNVLGTKTAQQLFNRFGLEVIFMDKRVAFKMPYKGWNGKGPWFAVAWYTWGLNIGSQMTFAAIHPDKADLENDELNQDQAI